MRVALIGRGKMGSAVAEAAAEDGWEVCAQFDRNRPFSAVESRDELCNAAAVIDFSTAAVIDDHVRRCVELRIPLVAGTTGANVRLDLLRSFVDERRGAVLYSPNFSVGVAILRRALRVSLALAAHLNDFDVSVHEVHHAAKRDRPSGTARLLAEDIRRALPWRYTAGDELSRIMDLPDGPDVSSSRVGSVFGEHTIRLEGSDDQIVFQHAARSRRGFAAGALQAARWIMGRSGFFTMDDMLDDWIGHPSDVNFNHIEA